MARKGSMALVMAISSMLPGALFAADPADTRVIHISVDGMGWTYPQTRIDGNFLPNMKKFQTEGAWTNNARNDYDYTITLPNHTTQMTGRPVTGASGHNYTSNVDPPAGQTLASVKGSYIASVFDVVHDNGLRTAMFVGKSKFSLYDTTYNSTNGALDITGPSNGRDKIDVYGNVGTATAVVSSFITSATANPIHYSFLHFSDPDDAGHDFGWGTANYNTALANVDAALGTLFNFVNNNANYKGKTYIVLTADHGGGGGSTTNHSLATSQLNYTIPFWVWNPGVVAPGNLYAYNSSTRAEPGATRPLYTAAIQPIRNGDAANLETSFFGLGAVPGSTINTLQNLAVPEPATLVPLVLAGVSLLTRRSRRRR